jgi:hypothetical protein
MTGNSDSVNEDNEQRNVTDVNEVCMQDISMLLLVWETFCGIHGTRFEIPNLE